MDLSVFEQAGLTQAEAARVIGVTRLTFIRWLKGAEPGPLAAQQVKTHAALTKVAMKMNLLPHRLPPSRGNKALRQELIADTYAQARAAVAKLKARRAAS